MIERIHGHGVGRHPESDRAVLREIGDDVLIGGAAFDQGQFETVRAVPFASVPEVLRQCVTTVMASPRRWMEFPRGAAVRVRDEAAGTAPITYLHRDLDGFFQLIRRMVHPCTLCGRAPLIYLDPDGAAACAECALGRD